MDFADPPEHGRSRQSGAPTDAKSAGKSSFAARSVRSRRMGPQTQARLDEISDQIRCTEATVDDLRNQVMQLMAKHEQGWDVVSLNRQEL